MVGFWKNFRGKMVFLTEIWHSTVFGQEFFFFFFKFFYLGIWRVHFSNSLFQNPKIIHLSFRFTIRAFLQFLLFHVYHFFFFNFYCSLLIAVIHPSTLFISFQYCSLSFHCVHISIHCCFKAPYCFNAINWIF